MLLGGAQTGEAGAQQVPPAPQRHPVAAASFLQDWAPPDGWTDSTLRTYGSADYRWALESLGRERLTLERFRGKVLFINVWASWCKPCMEELPTIERLARSLAMPADSSIAVLLITPERRGTVEAVVRRRALTSPVYLERKRTPAAWRLLALPTTFIVAPDGNIVLHHRGAARWDTEGTRAFLRALGH